MRRIDTTNRAIDLFGAGKHGWKNGVPGTSDRPTEGTAPFFNAVQEEFANALEGHGVVLDPENNAQLSDVLKEKLKFDPEFNYVALTIGRALFDVGPQITAFEGVVMNSSGEAQRIANSAALANAAAFTKKIGIPAGTFWLAPENEIPVDLQLSGAGRGLSFIKGDGDLFRITASAFGVPVFRDLSIANDATRGKLFKTVVGSDIGRVQFERVDFGKANHHIHASDICVDWLLIGCRFNDAAVASRVFTKGIWGHNEIGCYTWFNVLGLDVYGSSVSCNIGGVFEYNASSGIRLTADDVGGEIDGWTIACHFEGNGSSAGAADIMFRTTAATRMRSINLTGSRFAAPNVSQVLRINDSILGGGNLDGVTIGPGCVVMGSAELCPNTSSYVVSPAVYFQSGTVTARPTNLAPVHVESQFAGFAGSVTVLGVEAGNGAVQASVVPPPGTKWAEIRVQGNSFNGTPNTNNARLQGTYRASGNRVSSDIDVDSSLGGVNQGFVLTWAGAIQIANKNTMTNNQSADTTIWFFK